MMSADRRRPPEAPDAGSPSVDPNEHVDLLLRDLRASRKGLASTDADRRLLRYGANELQSRKGLRWPGELARQLTHPLALLLWAAAGLAAAAGIVPVAIAVVVVIVLNAGFAFVQELQAERAVEALRRFLPPRARCSGTERPIEIDAGSIVPGDILLIAEGARISADARLIEGAIEVDASALTGESSPVIRSAEFADKDRPLIQARDLVFSGTSCTGGEARGIVFATGMRTELGRIAALSERVESEESPLEARYAGSPGSSPRSPSFAGSPSSRSRHSARLPLHDAFVLAIGLIVGNVPEGLLPVITLALAVGVRGLVRNGAVVKRLSAVETLGSTDVICTDKTGTLTENRMTVLAAVGRWRRAPVRRRPPGGRQPPRAMIDLAAAMSACSNARIGEDGRPDGDPTEVAMLLAARELGADVGVRGRNRAPGAGVPLRPDPEADGDGRSGRPTASGPRQGRAGGAAAALRLDRSTRRTRRSR